jgi:hypothetical protein
MHRVTCSFFVDDFLSAEKEVCTPKRERFWRSGIVAWRGEISDEIYAARG